MQRNYILSTFYNLIFIGTGTICTGLLSIRGTPAQMLLSAILACLIYSVLAFRYDFISKTFQQKNIKLSYLLLAWVFSLTTAPAISQAFTVKLASQVNQLAYMINYRLNFSLLTTKRLELLLSIAASIALFIFFYWLFRNFLPRVGDFIKGLDKVEKSYLLIITIALALLTIFVFNATDVFYGSQALGSPTYYDLIYTTDSGSHLATNVYQNLNAPENDIRQPLFGLFALPFGSLAKIAASLINLIWPSPNTYPISCNIIQTFLLSCSMILLSRLMQLTGLLKIFFLIILSLSYPFLLFSLNMEQYIIAVFWLILLIYAYFNSPSDKPLCYIGATGSMLTSGIFFPLLAMPSPNPSTISAKLIHWLQKLGQSFVLFFVVTIIAGQLPLFLTAIAKIKLLMRFAGVDIGLSAKLLQYLNFVAACIFAPKASADFTTYAHVSYQLDQVNTINFLGLAILLLAIIGFIRNYQKPFAKICFTWLSFSFVLLCLIGWGSIENGQILYSLYFSWAIISLVFMAIQPLEAIQPLKAIQPTHVLKQLSHLQIGSFALIILAMAIINSQGLADLIKFGLEYYPVIK